MNLEGARHRAPELAEKVRTASRLYEQTDRKFAERIDRANFPERTGREPTAQLAGWGKDLPKPLDSPSAKTTEQLLADHQALKREINAHNARLASLPRDASSVAAYNAEKAQLDAKRVALEAELRARGVQMQEPGSSPAPANSSTPEVPPPFPPPTQITGMTEHGAQQVNTRDGGLGSASAQWRTPSPTPSARPASSRINSAGFTSTLGRTQRWH